MPSVGNIFCYSCFLQLSIWSFLLALVLTELWAWTNRPLPPQRRLKGVVRNFFFWPTVAVVMWSRSLGRSFENAATETHSGVVFYTGNIEQSIQLQSGFEIGGGVSCGYKHQPLGQIQTALAWGSSCISLCLYKNNDLNGWIEKYFISLLFPECFLICCFLFFLLVSMYFKLFHVLGDFKCFKRWLVFMWYFKKKLGCELSELAPCCLRNFVQFSVIWMSRSLLCLNTSGMRWMRWCLKERRGESPSSHFLAANFNKGLTYS